MARLIVTVITRAARSGPMPLDNPHALHPAEERMVAGGYAFDLRSGVAFALDGSRPPIKLKPAIHQLLRFLWLRPSRGATSAEIHDHLRALGVYGGDIENVRKIVDQFRRELGLGPRDVLVGRAGTKGGGFDLAPEDTA
ncbi:hypothetical protein EPO34_02665 [Patescibacteria group bacterium]|nr:MAG: hypothetical protein EPO34_02665 [Patescibacteria group bacterium]